VWLAAAALIVAWGIAVQPRAATRVPAGGIVTLAPAPPGEPLLSVWVRWDAPPGQDGWIVLEAGAPWPAGAEAFWRRRVHPGWNLITWSPTSWLPAGAPVTVRLVDGRPEAWGVAEPWTAGRYGVRHLVALRGLLAALAVGAVAALAGAAAELRASRWPGPWALALGAVTLLGLALRLRALDAQSLWFDEVLTAIGSQSLDWVLYTPQIFGHPPLQYLAGWLAGGAAAGEASLRVPFVLAGAATVAALGALGRRLFGPTTGLVAAVALALSPFHVELSQTARPYAPLLLFTVLSVLLLLEAVRREAARPWLLFTATTALIVYTHYLGATVLAFEVAAAALLLGARGWRGGVAAAVSFAGIGVLLAPWVPVLSRLAAAQIGHGELPAPALHELVVNVFVPQSLGPAPAAGLGLTLAARGLAALRRQPRLACMLLLWLLTPVALIWLAQPRHFVAGRHLALLMPPLLLLLAHGVTASAGDVVGLARRLHLGAHGLARAVGAGVAVSLLGAWSLPVGAGLRQYYESRHGFDWRTVAGLLDATIPPGEPVLATIGAGYPLRHYWRPEVEVLEPETLRDRLGLGLRGRPAWVVVHMGWDRPAELDGWLERHAVRVVEIPSSWSQPGVQVWRLRGR
jgi:4-amino-4-deoxy-L-arabinose transferase-like glycosyltransferase